MRIADIDAELPNGFHDAKLVAIHRNLESEDTVLEVELLTGLPDDGPENRERVRDATLTFKGTKIVVIEPPSAESSFQFPGRASITITEDEPGALPAEIVEMVSDKVHAYTVFVREWLSNIQIAAADVEFKWSETQTLP